MRMRSFLRANLTVAFGLVALALLASALTTQRPAAAQDFTVDWGPIQVISDPTLRAVYPSVIVDSSEKLHVVYLVEDSSSTWNLLYTNNVDGAFATPTVVQPNIGSERTPFFKLALGTGNTLHLVYSLLSSDKQIYYRQATLNGATANWSAPQRISDSGIKSIDPWIAFDAAGNMHIAWADERCGWPIYNVFYRVRSPDGTLSPTTTLKPNCGIMQRSPKLVFTNDGKLHAVFIYNSELYYARLEASGWVSQDISVSPGLNTYNPSLASDGTALYVAWDEGTNGHDIHFRRSADGGQNWSNIVAFSDTPDFASYPTVTYAATRKRVYVAWGDANSMPAMQTRIWYREFNPDDGTTSAARLVENQPGPASWPALDAGRRQVALDWQDKSTGVWRALAMVGSLCGRMPATTSGPMASDIITGETTIYLPLVANNSGC